jgi:hypothetical protein
MTTIAGPVFSRCSRRGFAGVGAPDVVRLDLELARHSAEVSAVEWEPGSSLSPEHGRGTALAASARMPGSRCWQTDSVKAGLAWPNRSLTTLSGTPSHLQDRGVCVAKVVQPDRRQCRFRDMTVKNLAQVVRRTFIKLFPFNIGRGRAGFARWRAGAL